MSAVIIGIGTASPAHQIDRETATRVAQEMSSTLPGQAKKIGALYRRSGIESRGSVLLDDHQLQSFYPPASSPEDRGPSTACRSERYAQEASKLAVASAQAALANSSIDASEITHLITVTCTGFSAPGIDIGLIDRLGLAPTTERVQVGFMGCHGAINAMRVARGLLAAQPNARILLCSVELCSLHYQYGYNADRIVSGALFADGSASLVLASSDGDAAVSETAQSKTTIGQIVATGSLLVPNSREMMTWKIGNHGYEMTLSANVPGLIESELKGFLENWLAANGESLNSIGGWAVHPGGSRILTAVENAIGLSNDELAVSRAVLAQHGNMSSATMLYILTRFAESNLAEARPKPWLMLGFGPGLEIEVALIR